MQRLRPLSITAALLILTAACGGSKPSTPAPPGQTGDTITGRERFGWTQRAGSPDELQTYRYALYIDGQRTTIEGEACSPDSSGTSADCSAPLPTLSAGRHTLEVAAFFVWDDAIVEGPRSPVLQVTVAGVLAGGGRAMVSGGAIVSSDGLRMRADVIARELHDPVDVAATSGGRVLVADRSGELRIVDVTGRTPEVRDNLLHALSESPEPGITELRSIAPASDFDESGTFHVAFMTADRGGPVLRLARLRVRGETAGEAAVIGSFHLTDSHSSAVVRSGPDGLLYLAIGSGDDRSAQGPTSPAGTILRLRADGSRPDDNPRGSLLYSLGHHQPRGLAWLADDRSMWEAERAGAEDEINRIASGAHYGWPLASPQGVNAGRTEPALVLPAQAEVAGVTAVADAGSPLSGDLIVATTAGHDLLRLRRNSEGRLQLQGRLLQRRFGRIGQVAAAGGSLYFVTANQAEWGPGHEVLVRLTPQPLPERADRQR